MSPRKRRDDEPELQWLENMIDSGLHHTAAIVTGGVLVSAALVTAILSWFSPDPVPRTSSTPEEQSSV